jgi:hypothetical protein
MLKKCILSILFALNSFELLTLHCLILDLASIIWFNNSKMFYERFSF